MRVLHTEPLDVVAAREINGTQQDYNIGHANIYLSKSAGSPRISHGLSGKLYLSKNGWLLLSVPNALVRGAFDALDEHGVELPLYENSLNAHITVMHKDEVSRIGANKISERGHSYNYTLGPLQVVNPKSWDEVAKVWFINVYSPDLQTLRKSYGLSPKPNNNKFDFHITVAIRKKNVLTDNNEVKKSSVDLDDEMIDAYGLVPKSTRKRKLIEERTLINESDDAKELANLLNKRIRVRTPRRTLIKRAFIGALMRPLMLGNFVKTKFRDMNTIRPGIDPIDRLKEDDSYLELLESMPEHLPDEITTPIVTNSTTEPVKEVDPKQIEEQLAIEEEAPKQEGNWKWQIPLLAGSGLLTGIGLSQLFNHLKQGQCNAQTRNNESTHENDARREEELWWLCEAEGSERESSFRKRAQEDGAITAIFHYYNARAELTDDEKVAIDKMAAFLPKRVEDKGRKIYYDLQHKLRDRTPGDLTPSDFWFGPSRWGLARARDVYKLQQKLYERLEKRYGPGYARAAVGAWAVATPIPGPWGPVVAAPILGVAETHKFIKDRFGKKKDDPSEKTAIHDSNKKRKKSILDTPGLAQAIAGGGLATAALAGTQSGGLPVQVTRFPGMSKPVVIRGPITPGASASSIEGRDDAYLSIGPGNRRVHVPATNLEDAISGAREALGGRRIGILDLHGHGGPRGQAIGHSDGPGTNAITSVSATEVGNALRDVMSDRNPLLYMYGCSTGLCDPNLTGNSWGQALSDASGATVLGSRGYTYTPDDMGDNYAVLGAARAGDMQLQDIGGDSNAWTVWQPYNYPQRLVERSGLQQIESKIPGSKINFGSLPNNQAMSLMYQAGKPSSVLSSIIAPLLANRTAARNTALAGTALATPMALSEILTRIAEARGKLSMSGETGLMPAIGTHLSTQAKALPYLGLAAAPLLSYGLADKLFGRWKKDERKNERKDKE